MGISWIQTAMLCAGMKKYEWSVLGEIASKEDCLNDHKVKNAAINTAAFNELVKINNNKPTFNDYALAFILVQLAVKHYEGNYTNVAEEYFGEPYNTDKARKIFCNVLRHMNLSEFGYMSGAKKQFVEMIKAHAFITEGSQDNFFEFIYNFFEFIYNFFEIYLDRNIYINFDNNIKRLSDYVKDPITYKSDQRISVVNLAEAQRKVIKKIPADALVKIFKPLLQEIHECCFDENRHKVDDKASYFTQKLNEWWYRTKPYKITERNNIRKRGAYGTKFYRPYIILQKNIPNIVIPSIVLPEYCAEQEMYYYILTENGRIIEKNPLDMYRKFGDIVSEEISVEVDDLFGEYEIRICCSDTKNNILKNEKRNYQYKIYKADFRIYDSNDNYRRSLGAYGDYYIYVKDIRNYSDSDDCQRPLCIDCTPRENLTQHSRYRNWRYYELNYQQGTKISINEVSLYNDGNYYDVNFDRPVRFLKLFDENNKPIPAVRNHPSLTIRIAGSDVDAAFIQVQFNNEVERIPVSEYASEICPVMNSQKSEVDLYLSLEDALGNLKYGNGEYTVFLDIPNKESDKLTRYMLLRDLIFRYYLNDSFAMNARCYRYRFVDKGYVTVEYNESIKNGRFIDVDNKIKFKSLGNDINRKLYEFNLYDDIDHIEYEFEQDNKKYYAHYKIILYKFGFNKNNLQITGNNRIWHEDMTDDFIVEIPEARSAKLHFDEVKHISGKMLMLGKFSFDISEIRALIKHDKSAKSFYKMRVDFERESIFGSISRPNIEFCILKQPKVEIENFYQVKNGTILELNVLPVREDIHIVADVKLNDRVLIEKISLTAGKNLLECSLKAYNQYEFIFYRRIDSLFGFGLDINDYEEISREEYRLLNYNLNNLEGVYLEDISLRLNSGKFTEFYPKLNNHIVIGEKLEKTIFGNSSYRCQIRYNEGSKRKNTVFGLLYVENVNAKQIKFGLMECENEEEIDLWGDKRSEEWEDLWIDKIRNRIEIISNNDNELIGSRSFNRFKALYNGTQKGYTLKAKIVTKRGVKNDI